MRIVIKVGGELLAPTERNVALALVAEITTLRSLGYAVVVVHGGGQETTNLQKRLGQSPRIIAGRRVTDDDALDAIKMVVGGKLNIELCALLTRAGSLPIGLSGPSSLVLRARKREPKVMKGYGDEPTDFGHVGDVVGVNHALLELLIGHEYIPVLACIGGAPSGEVFNINADAVAGEVAKAIGAQRLILVTGTQGVLRDLSDPASRLRRLTKGEAEEMIALGTVAGGMIPKLEEAFGALLAGVEGVHIVGKLGPGDLQLELCHPGSIGTALMVS